ncbi:chromosomal replication initiator protein DnaA [Halothiobacillus sp. DCM-1]|uniref:chromosomal replication initiator protein DnaA n=1 Tax=Halothiobacillus sp. DCM-1 TaxID=3112558 RepID=UPI00324AE918
MSSPVPSWWTSCVEMLGADVPKQQITMYIQPLQPEWLGDGILMLWAPHRFVMDMVTQEYLSKLRSLASQVSGLADLDLRVQVGSAQKTPSRLGGVTPPVVRPAAVAAHTPSGGAGSAAPVSMAEATGFEAPINRRHNFAHFIEGKSNQVARAASLQVAENPGTSYNPLFIYGGVGLGKTHLMQAIGNAILEKNPQARVIYLHSERYVQLMLRDLRSNTIEQFKERYRSANALLIDDIQFFAGKQRSQEEFFYLFNALIEQGQQVIMTSDRFPKEIEGLEERLKSRFGWGLTVCVEPPDLETRVAILQSKAEQQDLFLPSDVAFFIAKRVRSNVRELEGALRRVTATARFTEQVITVETAKEALKDLIAAQAKLVTLENIQKTVADYYQLKAADLIGDRRTRSIVRPRQIAMSLAKELTNHSLPEIGAAFGGRDHSTVIHACRKIDELRHTDSKLNDEYNSLRHTLSG